MQPTQDHLSHPAFIRIVDSRRDEDTGLTVALVRYREDHPDYHGGDYIEVTAWNGECLDEDFDIEDLDEALAEAVERFGDEC